MTMTQSGVGWRRRAAVGGFAAVLAGLAACGGGVPRHEFNGRAVDPPRAAPELVGTNWDGQPFRLADHRGRVVFLFFGYTFCPDVCPMTLSKAKRLVDDLGGRADDLEVVFVSVDPGRDTVDKLAQYVPAFDRRFAGVRLEPAALEAVRDALGLTIQYGQPKEGPNTSSYYYVDHTGTYYLIDRKGMLRVTFPPSATPEQVLPDVETLMKERG